MKAFLTLLILIALVSCKQEIKEKRKTEIVYGEVIGRTIFAQDETLEKFTKRVRINHEGLKAHIEDDKLFNLVRIGDKVQMSYELRFYKSGNEIYIETENFQPVIKNGMYKIKKKGYEK